MDVNSCLRLWSYLFMMSDPTGGIYVGRLDGVLLPRVRALSSVVWVWLWPVSPFI